MASGPVAADASTIGRRLPTTTLYLPQKTLTAFVSQLKLALFIYLRVIPLGFAEIRRTSSVGGILLEALRTAWRQHSQALVAAYTHHRSSRTVVLGKSLFSPKCGPACPFRISRCRSCRIGSGCSTQLCHVDCYFDNDCCLDGQQRWQSFAEERNCELASFDSRLSSTLSVPQQQGMGHRTCSGPWRWPTNDRSSCSSPSVYPFNPLLHAALATQSCACLSTMQSV